MRFILLGAGVAASVLSGCASFRAECATHGGSAWWRVTSESFEVKTNLDRDDARAAALELERSLAVLRHTFPSGRVLPQRIEAVIFRDEVQLQELVENRYYLGAMMRDFHGPMLAIGSTPYLVGGAMERGVALHELAHHVASHVLARQPRWLAEGLATYLETARIGEDGSVISGEPADRDVSLVIGGGVLPVEALWAWDLDLSDPLEQPVLEQRRYATSWLLVHYLFNHREAELLHFLDALAAGTPPRAAFAEGFPSLDAATLDGEVSRYLEGGSYKSRLFKLGPIPLALEVASLPDAEAHAAFARIARGIHDPQRRLARQRREIAAALALDPKLALALELEVLATPDRDEAMDLAASLVALHPDDARGWRLLALTQPPTRYRTEARPALRTALALAPDDPDVNRELAGIEVALGNAAEALALAQKAAGRAPHRPDTHATLARALAVTDRCSEAAAELLRARELIDEHVPEPIRRAMLVEATHAVEHCEIGPSGLNARTPAGAAPSLP